MKKITEDIKESMKKLRKEGMTYKKIAETLGLAESTIQYHINPEYKKKQVERMVKYNKGWAGKKEYQKNYRRKRYEEDSEFRERLKKHSREYWRRKNG